MRSTSWEVRTWRAAESRAAPTRMPTVSTVAMMTAGPCSSPPARKRREMFSATSTTTKIDASGSTIGSSSRSRKLSSGSRGDVDRGDRRFLGRRDEHRAGRLAARPPGGCPAARRRCSPDLLTPRGRGVQLPFEILPSRRVERPIGAFLLGGPPEEHDRDDGPDQQPGTDLHDEPGDLLILQRRRAIEVRETLVRLVERASDRT